MHGLSAFEIMSAAFCTSTGSANVFDEALYFPASGAGANQNIIVKVEQDARSPSGVSELVGQ